MYSQKLQQFVNDNRPSAINLEDGQVVELASVAGLEIVGDECYPHIGTRSEASKAIVAWGELSERPRRVPARGFFRRGDNGSGYMDHPTEKERCANYLLFDPSEGVEVRYREKVDGTTVTYTPSVGTKGSGWSGRNTPNPEERMLEAANLEPVVIDLPEPVVTLPVPSWVQALCGCMSGQEWTESITCFASEVADLVDPFIEQLQALKG